jgi:hypothetical protein
MDGLEIQHDILEDGAYHDEELLQLIFVLGAFIIEGADEARPKRRVEHKRPLILTRKTAFLLYQGQLVIETSLIGYSWKYGFLNLRL